jgi:hypothetical protein
LIGVRGGFWEQAHTTLVSANRPLVRQVCAKKPLLEPCIVGRIQLHAVGPVMVEIPRLQLIERLATGNVIVGDVMDRSTQPEDLG